MSEGIVFIYYIGIRGENNEVIREICYTHFKTRLINFFLSLYDLLKWHNLTEINGMVSPK